MRLNILATLIAAVMLSWTAQNAEAGAIRYLGRKIKRGTTQVAQSTVVPAAKETQAAGKATDNALSTAADKTKNGVETAAGAVGAAGSATGNVVKTGAIATKDGTVAVADAAKAAPGTIVKGAEATPGLIAKGSESVGKKVWHAIW